MGLQNISKRDMMQLLVLPLVFILIFMVGVSIFIILDINNYWLDAGWCFITAIILGIVVVFFAQKKIKVRYK
jgi:hypothetical protein